MKKNKFFKKALSVFMAAVTMFTMIGSSGLTAFAAGEQTAVYIVEFPRSGDANSGANWGNSTMSFMNGWSMPSLRTMHMRAIGSHTGQICYCIEPGIGITSPVTALCPVMKSKHISDVFCSMATTAICQYPGTHRMNQTESQCHTHLLHRSLSGKQ